MKRCLALLVGSTLAVALAAPASAQDIDTGVGSSSISSFGKSNTATYGQTFTVGADPILDSFSMWLRWSNTSSSSILFDAFVMGWDGGKATGPILYQTSTARSGPATGVTQRYDFFTGGLALTSGQTYVAFLSTSNRQHEIAAGSATAVMPQAATPYAGGNFVYMNNGTNFGALTTSNWTQWTGTDAALAADFSAAQDPTVTPEPVSMALLGTGLAGLGAVRRRRRSADGDA